MNGHEIDGLLERVTARNGHVEPWSDEVLYAMRMGDTDEVVNPPDQPVTRPGDRWIIGNHVLLCGDSRRSQDVKRLMQGARATCIFTDPPYGVAIEDKNRFLDKFGRASTQREFVDIVDDTISPESLKQSLLTSFVNTRRYIMADDCTLFVCSPQGGELGMMMMMMMKDAGLIPRHVLIWRKNSPVFSLGRLDYDYQHEPILMTWGKRHKRVGLGRWKTSIWDAPKPRASAAHATMKPVELPTNAILNHTDPGDAVADIYLGSGTTLVAAEQTGRRGYGMEIEPRYCDVTLTRMLSIGVDGVREGDGARWSEIKKKTPQG